MVSEVLVGTGVRIPPPSAPELCLAVVASGQALADSLWATRRLCARAMHSIKHGGDPMTGREVATETVPLARWRMRDFTQTGGASSTRCQRRGTAAKAAW